MNSAPQINLPEWFTSAYKWSAPCAVFHHPDKKEILHSYVLIFWDTLYISIIFREDGVTRLIRGVSDQTRRTRTCRDYLFAPEISIIILEFIFICFFPFCRMVHLTLQIMQLTKWGWVVPMDGNCGTLSAEKAKAPFPAWGRVFSIWRMVLEI